MAAHDAKRCAADDTKETASAERLKEAYRHVRERVGETHSKQLGRVSARDFQRFAFAVGEINPAYFDDEDARAAGLLGIRAPPLFLSSVLGWEAGPEEEELRADGASTAETAGLPLEGLRLMGAGQELDFHAAVNDGTSIVVETSIDNVQLKQGQSGTFMILTILRDYVDAAGTGIATCRENFIARTGA